MRYVTDGCSFDEQAALHFRDKTGGSNTFDYRKEVFDFRMARETATYLNPSLVFAEGAPPGPVLQVPLHFLIADRARLFFVRWLVIGR